MTPWQEVKSCRELYRPPSLPGTRKRRRPLRGGEPWKVSHTGARSVTHLGPSLSHVPRSYNSAHHGQPSPTHNLCTLHLSRCSTSAVLLCRFQSTRTASAEPFTTLCPRCLLSVCLAPPPPNDSLHLLDSCYCLSYLTLLCCVASSPRIPHQSHNSPPPPTHTTRDSIRSYWGTNTHPIAEEMSVVGFVS